LTTTQVLCFVSSLSNLSIEEIPNEHGLCTLRSVFPDPQPVPSTLSVWSTTIAAAADALLGSDRQSHVLVLYLVAHIKQSSLPRRPLALHKESRTVQYSTVPSRALSLRPRVQGRSGRLESRGAPISRMYEGNVKQVSYPHVPQSTSAPFLDGRFCRFHGGCYGGVLVCSLD
jgi:hypothetical protein